MASHYPEAYIHFLTHFHGDRDFFECHELLEQYWKEHPESEYKNTWVGLIQSAVGLYHYRRGNTPGARKSIANSLCNSNERHLSELGIDGARWLEQLKELLGKLEADPAAPYEDLTIPLTDLTLQEECERRCAQSGFVWGSPSRMERDELIHRHMLRDRTDVIAARRQALLKRHGGQ